MEQVEYLPPHGSGIQRDELLTRQVIQLSEAELDRLSARRGHQGGEMSGWRAEKSLVVTMVTMVTTMGDRHCSNDCAHMKTTSDGIEYHSECSLFEKELKWDKSCKYHGYLRCRACVSRAKEEHLEEQRNV